MGYPTEIFLHNPILDKLECSICNDVLEDPVSTGRCGHLFCRACITATMSRASSSSAAEEGSESEEQSCPNCRSTLRLEDLKDDLTAREIVKALQVECDQKYQGCDWIGPLSNLCDHKQNCGFVLVECTYAPRGCAEKAILRKDLAKHQQTCLYRDFDCNFCNQIITFNDLDHHLEHDCPESIIRCSQGCGGQVPRKQLDEHIYFHCPLSFVECPFAKHGCPVTMVRRDELENHNTLAASDHLRLMCDAFNAAVDLNKRADEVEKLKDEMQAVIIENQNLQRELRNLKRMISDKTEDHWTHSSLLFFNGIRQLLQMKPHKTFVTSHSIRAFGRQWQIKFYPNGDQKENCFALYLSMVNGQQQQGCKTTPIKVDFILTLVNQLDERKNVSRRVVGHEFNPDNYGWGFPEAFTHEIFNSDPGFSVDDILVVALKMSRSSYSQLVAQQQQQQQQQQPAAQV